MNFAVIDTETNWNNKVMSIGVVISNDTTFTPVKKLYYILTPEYTVGGVFSSSLFWVDDPTVEKLQGSRSEVLPHLTLSLVKSNVEIIFAYNARFDYGQLPELKRFTWVDIMKVSASKQYNKYIPDEIEVYASSQRIKKGYGVEPIYRMITGKTDYREKHNAYHDAVDELEIMKHLELPMIDFLVGKIN